MSEIDTAQWRELVAAGAIRGLLTHPQMLTQIADAIDALRAENARVSAERDEWRRNARGWEQVHNELKQRVGKPTLVLVDRMQAAEQRVAALTAALAEMTAGYTTQMETISRLLKERRAIEAVLDGASGDHIGGVTVVRVPLVRAALTGDDQEAETD